MIPHFPFIRKEYLRDAGVVVCIAAVGASGFFLGVLSERESGGKGREGGIIIQNTEPAPTLPAAVAEVRGGGGNEPLEGGVVASKTGTKYHFPWCAGAQRIQEGNKVWFASAEEARKAGYQPALNCKGLQ